VVHFNIGVCAYRLGHYQRAEQAFAEVARTQNMAALAHYNLGLVALAREDQTAAARWFSTAEQETSDERLRALAAGQLDELRVESAERNWFAYGTIAAGYDDNVALVSDANVLGVSGLGDGFLEAQLALTAPLARLWQFDAGMVLIDYQELDIYDQDGLYAGGRYRRTAGNWSNEVGLQLAYSTLDGEGFENRQTVALQTGTSFGPEWRLRLRYRGSNVEGLSDFEELSGLRHEANVRLTKHREPWDMSLAYQFEVNDYDDEALSDRRQQLGFTLERRVYGNWVTTLDALWRHSRYDMSTNGTEQRVELGLSLMRVLSERWRLIARYGYADNDADIPVLNYQRNRMSLGVEALL
jgi:Tetratricopeptide repeat